MAEVCYTARATTKQQVLVGIDKLTFKPTNMGNTRTTPFFYSKKAFTVSLSANSTQVTLAKAW